MLNLDSRPSAGILALLFLAALSAPARCQETILHSFSYGADGVSPNGLVEAPSGDLYGVTLDGGSKNYGTAYRVTPAGALQVLHTFGGGADGANPAAGLMLASDGNLYGVTSGSGVTFGGAGATAYGTVFRLTPSGGLSTLHAFGYTDGAYPAAPPVEGADGALYGVTADGGANGLGAIFRITLAGSFSLLYSFSGPDGMLPAGLIPASDGNLYGAATEGGGDGYGDVFQLTPAGALTVLYSFTGGLDGALPYGGVTVGTDGNLYGTTSSCGAGGYGTAFQLAPGGAFTLLHSFAFADGAYPNAGLIQATDGNLYGTCPAGGLYGDGNVFQVTASGSYADLLDFVGGPGDGAGPVAPPVQLLGGDLAGTTVYGGANGPGALFDLGAALPALNVTSVSPASADAGGPGFTLTVKGAGFVSGDTLRWNGAPLASTYVSAVELQAGVPSNLIASPGAALVTVETTSGGASNGRWLTVPVTTVTLASVQLSRDTSTGAITAVAMLENTGYLTAGAASVTAASLGPAKTLTALPAPAGDIAAAGSGAVTLIFPGAAGASGATATLKVSGVFGGGTFSGNLRVTLP